MVCLSCFKMFFNYENIFTCSKKHYYCVPCGKSMHLKCECYESLHLLTLKIAEENSSSIECLGNLLNIWQCKWNGSKKEFHEHFIRCHNNIEIFSQFQVSSVPFQSDQLLSTMTLVRAEEQAKPESFLYELMIKSPNENHCKIKFVEKIFALDDNVIRLRDKELCAAISFQTIKKHLYEKHIHFSFLIKRNCNESINSGMRTINAKAQPIKAKQVSHSVPNKGSMMGNSVRKVQSIPDVKSSGGGGVVAKAVISVDVGEAKEMKNQPSSRAYSSINKINNNKQFTSPAHCTEAMKRNDDELLQTSAMKADECYHIPNIMCQAYKNPDHKIYKQKYPTSCLSKPILKK